MVRGPRPAARIRNGRVLRDAHAMLRTIGRRPMSAVSRDPSSWAKTRLCRGLMGRLEWMKWEMRPGLNERER